MLWFYPSPNIFQCILHILYHYIYYSFMFEIKCTLVDSMWGHVDVPGRECHSVCLEPPFPSLWLEMIRPFTSTFCSEQLSPLRWPDTCADIPAKSRYDIIRMSCGDVLMMWGFWMMNSHHIYIRVGGYKRMNAWVKGVPNSEILGVELIRLN